MEQVKCINAACGWVGDRSQCVHFHMDPYQTDFCPLCESPVEAASANSATPNAEKP